MISNIFTQRRTAFHFVLTKGLVNHLSEHHGVVSCQVVAYERLTTGIQARMTRKVLISTATLTGILGGDNASKEVLLKRA